MDNQKPIILDSAKTGNLAVSYIQTIFEEQGWIFRRADGSTDFGIDGEVEITSGNKVTGMLFKCQIKGTASLEFEGEYTTVQVGVSTWNLWKSVNIPVIALLCDVAKKKIYWSLPLGFEPKKNAESVSLRFYEQHCLNEYFDEFNAIVQTWLESFPKQNILWEVPYFHNMFKTELDGLIGWGDPWCDAGEDENMKIRVFYSHVLELRTSLGLRNDMIISFDQWLIRNDGMWGDPLTFYHGTLSEVLLYIKYYCEEALKKLKLRLEKVELSFETNELVNYFRTNLFQEEENYTIVYSHPDKYRESFHRNIEKKMADIGISFQKWQPKNR